MDVDKVKPFLSEHPRPWTKGEMPCDGNNEPAAAAVPSVGTDTTAMAPRRASPPSVDSGKSRDDSIACAVDDATPFDRSTRVKKPPRHLDEYVRTTRRTDPDRVEATQQNDYIGIRLWEDRLRSGNSFEFVRRSNGDRHHFDSNLC